MLTRSIERGWPFHSRKTSLAVCLWLCTALAGCVTTTSSTIVTSGTGAGMGAENVSVPARPSAEVQTASDESDLRRRARLRLELATSYYEQGQTSVALDELKQVLNLDPTYADAYNLRGLIYMRLNDQKLSEESFRRSIALNPRDASALHNYGWFLCQSGRYTESLQIFSQALANPLYLDRTKTLLAQGLCEARAGQREQAERTLTRAYELDAANPVTGYNLSLLLYLRGEYTRAQFYIRRINNSELANAESLWLGVRVEYRMNNTEAMLQLGEQLKRRFPQSKEAVAYGRGTFND
jgi:type IV pilus assembly protein PilF